MYSQYYLSMFRKVKSFTDAYKQKKIRLTDNKGVFDTKNHVYDVAAVMGYISSCVDEAVFLLERDIRKGVK